MIGYALLGGELVPSDVDGLEVAVSVHSDGPRFKSRLVPIGDEALVGLDEEYVKGVFTGIDKVNEANGLPTGASLRFHRAACGMGGSSNLMFGRLSYLIVQLLTLPEEVSEKEISDLVDKSQRLPW